MISYSLAIEFSDPTTQQSHLSAFPQVPRRSKVP